MMSPRCLARFHSTRLRSERLAVLAYHRRSLARERMLRAIRQQDAPAFKRARKEFLATRPLGSDIDDFYEVQQRAIDAGVISIDRIKL